MKFVAFMLIFISVSSAFEDQCRGAYLKSIYENCMLANGGDRVVIEDLIHFKAAEDDNGKCFRECILQECKYYGDDGKLNHDVPARLSLLIHGGNESHVKPIEETVSKCLESQTYNDSNCNNAESFARCVIKQTPVKLKLHNVYD